MSRRPRVAASPSAVGVAPADAERAIERRARRRLVLAAAIPLLALILLWIGAVPLGKPDKFVYLYSPLVGARLMMVIVAAPVAAAAGAGVWLLGDAQARRRRAGLALVALSAIGLAAWTYSAPPQAVEQHVFNMMSPSHDGAFVLEAAQVRGWRAYLSGFPQRARTPQEQMRGTRVISNPPGATLLAAAVAAAYDRSAWLRGGLQAVTGELPGEMRRTIGVSLAYAWVLLLMWLAAAPLAYLAARMHFAPAPAAVLALAMIATPATLLFSPGKDPAQLALVLPALAAWLLAVRRDRAWPAAVCGGMLMLGCGVSLVCAWIGVALAAADLLAALVAGGERRGAALRSRLLRRTLPAAAAAGGVAILMYTALGYDVLSASLAVARSQAEVTRTRPDAMPIVWQALGAPLFLLFAGATFWWFLLRPRRDVPADAAGRFGGALAATTSVVLLATVGFTNAETPRLWIPFVPLLLIGAALRQRLFRAPDPAGRRLLALLAAVQVAAAAAAWAFMDMREAEMRLIQPADGGGARLFN